MAVRLPLVQTSSTAPDGTVYRIPSAGEARAAFRRIAEAAEAHRSQGGKVVVVQGLGFVGSAVAAVVASARNTGGSPLYFVIGVDQMLPATYWKVASINDGRAPVVSPDAELDRLIEESAGHNLWATTEEDAYSLADVVVVDVHLSVEDRVAATPTEIAVSIADFEQAVRAVGRAMRPDALILVETTVPVGTCESVVLPILRDELAARGLNEEVLLAHSYERVMPGPKYVASIRDYPRTYAGTTPEASARAREFLASFIDTESHPLWELPDTARSELAKLLENSYRAANIAFIHEWTLLAEQIGVNLFEIVDSIRVRTGTHDNMRYPGFGVGGYCLTKDPLLAQWGARTLLGSEVALETTLAAVETNFLMPLHTFELAAELEPDLGSRTVVLCGVAYTAGVSDTRNSASELLFDRLQAFGAEVRVHDPIVRRWPELPEVELWDDLGAALDGAGGLVLTVPHHEYRALSAERLARELAPGAFVVDAQNVLDDDTARSLHESGHRVAGVGKGHWRREGLHER